MNSHLHAEIYKGKEDSRLVLQKLELPRVSFRAWHPHRSPDTASKL